MLTPRQVSELMDQIEQIVEAVAGYRAKMEAAGFSPEAAEMMAVQWHALLTTQKAPDK